MRYQPPASAATLQLRLDRIAQLISPCPTPDLSTAGEDGLMPCSCGAGVWPCKTTRAAWVARGLNSDMQVQAVLRQVRLDRLVAGDRP